MGRGPSRFCIGQKLAIVKAAYAQPGMLYQVRKQYNVDWRNIKQWREKLLDFKNLNRQAKMHRPLSSIQKVVEGADVWEHIRQCIEGLRERDIAVTGTMLFHEVRR
jgi:hypothetical protein